MIIGSTIGGFAGVLTGVQIGKKENPYEIYGIIEEENTTFNAMFGLFAGAFTGATVGWVTSLFKKSTAFYINGNNLKWKLFKEAISN